MSKLLSVCGLTVLLLLAQPVAAARQLIRYALVSGLSDPHLPYMLAMLDLACSENRISCQFQVASAMNQSRALVQLGKPDGATDLFWGMTSQEREQASLPIRIPLDKGLIGWRVALLPADRSELLVAIHNERQLSRLLAGQVQDWPDTAILRNGGLPVLTTQEYGNLFPMLLHHRFDYFPRSVIEVQHEAALPAAKGLVIDPYLVIQYPTAMYFFVSPHQPALAAMLEKGLRAALKNGRFNQLFQRFNGQYIAQLNLAKRTVIHLPNPLLPAETPLTDARLWYRP